MDAQKNIMAGSYDIVILDEINVAMNLGMIKTRQVLEAINNKPKHVELILTGRSCPSVVRKVADIVTVMADKKHLFQRGVGARKGIDC